MYTTITKKNINDFKLLEEGEFCQLINGELIMTPAPSFKHQKVSAQIFMQINSFVQKQQLGDVLYAPVDVFFDDENVFEPDILFVSKERFGIIHDDGIHGAPDLIIEIISVTSGYHDTKTKKRIYEKYGVKEYWIVDPADLEVIGFKSQNGQFFEFFKSTGSFTIDLLKLDIELK